jgi:hypothetical protein
VVILLPATRTARASRCRPSPSGRGSTDIASSWARHRLSVARALGLHDIDARVNGTCAEPTEVLQRAT